MLTFFAAILFGMWFFQSAKAQENRHPKIWAAIGYFTFLITASLFSWWISLTYLSVPGFVHSSQNLKFAVAAVIVLGSFVMAGGCTALVWKLFLSPAAEGQNKQQVTENIKARHTLAMPGAFPWLFALTFITVSLLKITILTGAQRIFWPTSDLPGGPETLLIQNFNAFIQVGGLALILWRYQSWQVIALSWAALTPLLSLCHYLFTNITIGYFYAPPVTMFIGQYITALIGIGMIVLAVHRWGAGLKVLLGGCVASGMAGFLQFLIMVGSKAPLEHIAMNFLSVLTGSMLLALVLYAGLWLHASRPLSSHQKTAYC